jgi:hypothetical protein
MERGSEGAYRLAEINETEEGLLVLPFTAQSVQLRVSFL